MKRLLIIGAIFMFYNYCIWAFFVSMYKPTDTIFLAVAQYKFLNEIKGTGALTLPADSTCELQEPDGQESRAGAQKMAVCIAETERGRAFFAVALSPTARAIYSDFEGIGQ